MRTLAFASISIACLTIACAESPLLAYVPFNRSRLDSSSFFEQFDQETLQHLQWRISRTHKSGGKYNYLGEWEIEPAEVYPGLSGDSALVLKSPASHHAISYKFSAPFDNTGKDLVLQYEVKAQTGLNCAGAYIKLLDYHSDGADDDFNDETPYQIMFGPDVCGHNNKVQLILTRENPLTGERQEKHLTHPPLARTGKLSTLYTLILKADQSFEIRINGDVAKSGNLVEDVLLLSPALNPPKEAVDIHDTKPADWDDNEFIPDPEGAVKPDDYDEKYNSVRVKDPNAVKPKDWADSEPDFIEDPLATKPEEWDDEEDGEWLPPFIVNPRCVHNACGPWTAPTIPNPDYIGPWVPPMISNPRYAGEWSPRTIPNPAYYEDNTPTQLRPIGGMGFELWTMDPNLLFDNIYLGHSVKEAELIGNETFVPKEALERKIMVANKPRAKIEPVSPPKNFDELISEDESSLDDLVEFLKNLTTVQTIANIGVFYVSFVNNPLETIIKHPIQFVWCCVFFVIAFTVAVGSASFIIITFLQSKGDVKGSDVSLSEKQPKTIEHETAAVSGSQKVYSQATIKCRNDA